MAGTLDPASLIAGHHQKEQEGNTYPGTTRLIPKSKCTWCGVGWGPMGSFYFDM